MGFGNEVVVFFKFVFFNFGSRKFVNVADDKFETVIKFEEILRDLSSRGSQKFFFYFFVIAQANGNALHETADCVGLFFVNVLEARIDCQYTCQNGVNELVALDHFKHLLLLFSKIAVDFNVFGFGYQSRVERDNSFRYFF
jgi:hypothetical protein